MINVLIVDDEYIMRQGLRYMISWEEEGFHIVGEAANGQEALTLIETLHPQIVLCDVVMPLMDGIDFVTTVHKLYPSIEILVLSGYDKFDYVRRTLLNGASDYILKPTLNPQVLRQSLQNAVQRLPAAVLEQHADAAVLDGGRMLEQYILGLDLPAAFDTLRHQLAFPCFHLYAVDIALENAARKPLHDILLQKILRETAAFPQAQTLVFTLQESIACILFCHEHRDLAIESFAQSLSTQLAQLSDQVFSLFSAPFRELTQVRTIYQQEIAPYFGLKFYYFHLSLLRTADILPGCLAKPSQFHIFKITTCIENRQFDQAIELLYQSNRTALQDLASIQDLKSLTKNAIYHFLDVLDLEEAEQDHYRRELFQIIDGAHCLNSYLEGLDQIRILLAQLSTDASPSDQRMEDIVAYIRAHYNEELHLEDIATRFSFNYSYLSAFFNSQMRESFNDYLNRIRIEKACELLHQQNKSIAEISKEVGYSEHSYFCRVFRKVTGKTPSSWRRA